MVNTFRPLIPVKNKIFFLSRQIIRPKREKSKSKSKSKEKTKIKGKMFSNIVSSNNNNKNINDKNDKNIKANPEEENEEEYSNCLII